MLQKTSSNVDTPWSIYTSHSVILHGLHFCMCVWLPCKQEGGIQEVVAIKVSRSKGTILEGKEGGKLHSEESENKECKTIGQTVQGDFQHDQRRF